MNRRQKRYADCLARIEHLEIELGYRESPETILARERVEESQRRWGTDNGWPDPRETAAFFGFRPRENAA